MAIYKELNWKKDLKIWLKQEFLNKPELTNLDLINWTVDNNFHSGDYYKAYRHFIEKQPNFNKKETYVSLKYAIAFANKVLELQPDLKLNKQEKKDLQYVANIDIKQLVYERFPFLDKDVEEYTQTPIIKKKR